jgi:hypothetical protein
MAKAELYKGLPMWAKGVIALIVVGGVGVIAYTIYKKIQNAADKKDDRQQLSAEQKELSQMSVKPTLSKAQAEAMANAIFAALDGYASDEQAVYAQLGKLKNNADWLLLSTSYGTREISSGKLNPAPNFKGTLIGALTDELDGFERAAANAILKKNGVTYTI